MKNNHVYWRAEIRPVWWSYRKADFYFLKEGFPKNSGVL
jgi:hypothetical protein